MYKVDFPIDAKEAAAIARRRRVEEERKLRIFNPHQRLAGKDVNALKEQIQEKRDREQREKDLNEAWLREATRQQLVVRELQRRAEEDKKKVYTDVQEFRKSCQRFEDRREFDLNDPKRLSYPARLHDEDPRCGPASMQKFEGEDVSYRQRLVSQELQKKAWLDAQVAEKKQNQREYDEANVIYEQRLREMGLRTNELDRAQYEARKAVELTHKQYNLALAQEKQEQKNLERMADDEATLAHQLNMFHSELLSETNDATSVNGPFRVGRDRFKGYTEEMLKAIREEQLRQAQDKKRRQESEKQYDVAWEKMNRRYAIATTILDKETNDRKRDKTLEMTSTNLELAREQRLRQEYLNRLVFKGGFSQDFFEQFNTSTR